MTWAYGNLTVLDCCIRIAVAALAGALVGLERELRGNEAGVRTNLLVAVASALFTIMSAEVLAGAMGETSRIAAQVVSGMGFLGAGVIWLDGDRVRGLTTAATMWTVAALGMAAGAGFYLGVLAAGVVTMIALALRPVTRLGNRDRVRIVLALDDANAVDRDVLLCTCDKLGIETGACDESDGVLVLRRLTLPPEIDAGAIVRELFPLEGVQGVDVEGLRRRRRRRRRSKR